uniref:BPTI/Kunitz inhibitor domain-containing protein n=1 Tax=Parascaris univalens TaxID=6257 RepID=A0A915AR37_PARUN
VVLYVVVALAICRQSGSSTDDSILKTMQNDISANEEKTSNSICCATLLRPQSSYVNVTAQNVPGVSHLQTQKLYIYPQPPSFSKYGDPLQSLAVRSIPSSACNLPQQIGTGPYRIPRWYYNPARMRCELFYWSGCCGNANNFQTFHNCQQSCEESPNPCPHAPITPATPCASGSAVSGSCGTDQYCHTGQSPSTTVCCNRPGSVDRCSQPVVAGIGNANLQRWYFNSYSQQCQQFIYNGLRGNENNFLTQQECQNACVVNPCSRGIPYQNQGVNLQCTALNQGICPSGYYCHIGVDSRTSVCCQMLGNSRCTEPMSKGEGKFSLTRYYYDAVRTMCFMFSYFGMKGNANNFLTKEACELECPVWINPCMIGEPLLGADRRPQQCHQKSLCPEEYFCHIGYNDSTTVCCPSIGDPCVLPLNEGNGEHKMTRWYYDQSRRQCQQFIYKGLGGNENNFLLRDHCENTCPVWTNPCNNGEPILLSNNHPKLCNPSEADSCPSTHWCHPGIESSTTVCCPGRTNACNLRRIEGEGNFMQMRWYFDQHTQQCIQFIYKGLKGNANNFISRAHCEATCPIFIDPCPLAYASLSSSTRQIFSCSAANPQCPRSHWCHIGEGPETTVCCPNAGDPCTQLPKYIGIGVHSLTRWSYDPVEKKCFSFQYRGLKGNENNFVSKEACEAKCPVFENPCRVGEPYMTGNRPQICGPQFSCPEKYFCHIGAEHRCCCLMQGNDPCTQALEQGQGSYSLQRWYWNAASQQCISFAYRGLKGTQNNFLTQQDCERTCHAFQNPCSLGNPQLTQDGRPLACSAAQNTCSSTYWCHFGAVSQTTVCCPGRVEGEAICRQPMTMGSGGANLQRWYFNWNTRQCVPFIYGGLFGNQNNFRTLQQCQQTCPSYVNVCPTGSPLLESNGRPRPCTFGVDNCGAGYWCHLGLVSDEYQCCVGQPTNPAACQGMPYSVGVLGSQAPAATRWYYDQQTMSCRTFQYNGLKGNQNNFLTQEDCESTCHVFINPCIEAITLPPQQCSANVDTCPSGTFCLIGMSAETSICCPSQGNPCLLPRALGTGSGFLQRWYFSSQTGSCQPFTYTGLKGNENNFLTRERCEETCGPNPCPEGRPFLGADGRPQSCNSSGQSSSCPRTYWCHTGANELNTVCCPGAVNNPCNLPLVTGEGTANLERFYFDSSAGACRPFIYNGIKGNQNNFLTLLACQMVCQPLQNPCIGQPATTAAGQVLFCSSTNKDTCPVNFWCHIGANPETTVCCPGATNPCSVPLSPGTGNAGLQRWYYNADDRECQPFQYNGMRGNQNNFESQAECARTCPVFINPCIGDYANDSNGDPRVCNPLLSNGCDDEFFCLAGDTTINESGICCLKLTDDPCKAYMSEGEGESSLSRWYYSTLNGQCFPFVYRGRKGNQNNFLNKHLCEHICQPISNVCFGGEEALRVGGRIAQCSSLHSCPSTHYCHIGENARSSVCCKRRGNICDQQLMIGIGNARLLRWFYNNVEDECLPFNYSGLAGNENNFLTKADCQVTCPGYRGYCPHGKPLIVNGEISGCGIEIPCPKGYVCHVTRKDSKSVCCPDPTFLCLLDRDTAPCYANILKYGYNKMAGICRQFMYVSFFSPYFLSLYS